MGGDVTRGAGGIHIALLANVVTLFARPDRRQYIRLARIAHKYILQVLKYVGYFVCRGFRIRIDVRFKLERHCRI